jgi:hypothetical protein
MKKIIPLLCVVAACGVPKNDAGPVRVFDCAELCESGACRDGDFGRIMMGPETEAVSMRYGADRLVDGKDFDEGGVASFRRFGENDWRFGPTEKDSQFISLDKNRFANWRMEGLVVICRLKEPSE